MNEIVKLGMAYWSGQKDFKSEGQDNVSVDRSDFNWRRMEQIKLETQKTFEPFLTWRHHQAGSKSFRVVPDVPATAEFEVSEDPSSSTSPHTKGASMYFRFNVERHILPQGGEYKQVADNILNDVERILGDDGIDRFVSFCENNGIPILPFFASTAETKVKEQAALVLNLINSTLTKMAPNEVSNKYAYYALTNSSAKITENPNYLHMGYVPVSMSFSGEQVRHNNKADALVRMMVNKMSAGYGLNLQTLSELLQNDYIRSIYNKDPNKQYGEPNQQQTEELILHYEKTLKTLVAVYNLVDSKLSTIIREGLTGKGTVTRKIIDQLGLPIYRHGKKWSYLTTPYPVSIRDFQSLIMSINTPTGKSSIKSNWNIPADEWVDRQRNLFVPPDGLSQHPDAKLAESDPKLLMAPLRIVKKGMDKVAVWDKDNINLGRKHLIKRRDEITSLLQQFGGWTVAAWNKLSIARQKNNMNPELTKVFDLINSNFTGSNIFQSLINQYKDLNSFHANYITVPAVLPRSEAMEVEDTDEEDPLADVGNQEIDVVTGQPIPDNTDQISPELYESLKQYGSDVAKMMDFIYAVGHYASKTTYKRFGSDKPQGGRGGGNFTVSNNPEQSLTQYGVGHGTSSGMGRGGEIIISCKYAYRASWVDSATAIKEQVISRMSNLDESGKQFQYDNVSIDNIQSIIRSELKKKKYKKQDVGYQGARVHETNVPQNAQQPEFTSISEENDPSNQYKGIVIQETPRFWFGMSSTKYEAGANTGRAVGRAETKLDSMNDQNKVYFNSFTMCLDKLANVYPSLRTEIWPLNMKMEALRSNVKEALEETRNRLQQDIELVFATAEGRRDVLHQTQDSSEVIGKSSDIPETAVQNQEEKTGKEQKEETRYPSGDFNQPAVAPSSPVPDMTNPPVAVPSMKPNVPVQQQSMAPTNVQTTTQSPTSITNKKSKPKSMEMEDTATPRIMTRDRARSMGLKKKPISKGQLEENDVLFKIVEAANVADQKEMDSVANKLDTLAKLIKGL